MSVKKLNTLDINHQDDEDILVFNACTTEDGKREKVEMVEEVVVDVKKILIKYDQDQDEREEKERVRVETLDLIYDEIEFQRESVKKTRNWRRIKIHMDSQASHGVTSMKEIFGGLALRTDVTFRVAAWNGDKKFLHEHGATVMGPLIYSNEVDGTIIAMGTFIDMGWKMVWTDDNKRCMATHPQVAGVSLDFSFDNDSNCLDCGVTDTQWKDLCDGIHGFTECKEEQDEKVCQFTGTKDEKFCQFIGGKDKNLVHEAIRLHECSCHASYNSLGQCLKNNTLRNAPIDQRDVMNISFVCPMGCNACRVGKLKKRSDHPAKGVHKPDQDRPELPVRVPEECPYQEILGLDLMFIRKQPYLIAVGKKLGYTHVVPVASKKTTDVKKALDTVLLDYKSNQYTVAQSFVNADFHNDTQMRETVLMEPIGRTESDNEGAFIAIARENLMELGITSKFVAADEHVAYVERQIQTIKYRFDSTACDLSFELGNQLEPWLVVNVVNWINIMPSPKSPQGAWQRLTKRTLSYKSMTMTKFGEPVVAHRTHGNLGGKSASGELGISLGGMLVDGVGIYFMSLITRQVKVRRRFAIAAPIDMTDFEFEKNKQYIGLGGNAHGQDQREFLKEREAVVDTTSEHDTDTLLPLPGSYMVAIPSMDVANDLEPIIRNVPLRYPVEHMMDIEEESKTVYSSDPAERFTNELLSKRDSHHNHNDDNNIVEEEVEDLGTVMEGINLNSEEAQETNESKSPVASPVKKPSTPFPEPISRPSRTAKTNNTFCPAPVKTEHIKRIRGRKIKRKVRRKFGNKLMNKYGSFEETSIFKMDSMNWEQGMRNSEYAPEVKEAMIEEVAQMLKFGVFDPTGLYPDNYHRSHDMVNRKEDGRWKARVVAGTPIHDLLIDYGVDLYSPTIDMKIVFMILSLGLQQGHRLSVLDVKGAFLKAEMKTKGVYVRLQARVVKEVIAQKPEWASYVRKDGSMMVEANKAWYGLSAASALWNAEIDKTLRDECGYIRHDMVKCLYYKVVDGVTSYIMLHVDDLGVLMPKDSIEYNRVVGILEVKYGELRKQVGNKVDYIGLEITHDIENNKFEVGMSGRITKVYENYLKGVVEKHVNNPRRNEGFSETNEVRANAATHWDTTEYRSVVMTMSYISIVHPEVKYHISRLASKQSKPSVEDMKDALHVLQYVNENKNNPIVISAIGSNISIDVFMDAAFDKYSDSKSHSGLAVFIGEAKCAMFASSNKQHCVTRSSTDAEIVAAEVGVLLGAYYRDVLLELGIDAPVVYYEDNTSAISLIQTGTHSYDKKEKHMVRKVNFIHEYVADPVNRASMMWCDSEDMHADAMTKDLAGKLFKKHKEILKGVKGDARVDAKVCCMYMM